MKTLIQILTLGMIAAAIFYFFAQSGEDNAGAPVNHKLSELKPVVGYAPNWKSLMETSVDPAAIGH